MITLNPKDHPVGTRVMIQDPDNPEMVTVTTVQAWSSALLRVKLAGIRWGRDVQVLEVLPEPSRQRCIVKGCQNHTDEGTFVGELCSPCYVMLTTGRINHGKTWVHERAQGSAKREREIEEAAYRRGQRMADERYQGAIVTAEREAYARGQLVGQAEGKNEAAYLRQAIYERDRQIEDLRDTIAATEAARNIWMDQADANLKRADAAEAAERAAGFSRRGAVRQQAVTFERLKGEKLRSYRDGVKDGEIRARGRIMRNLQGRLEDLCREDAD